MTDRASIAGTNRVVERRRAVALARHLREYEGRSIRQIADRLGRSPALAALNRDAFISDAYSETTVDLEAHRSASDLHEVDLEDEQTTEAV